MTEGPSTGTMRAVLGDTIGDVEAFYGEVVAAVARLGIDVSELPLGHVAYRCSSFGAYRSKRDVLETVCAANVETEWHGRPISKLLLSSELPLGKHHSLSLVELIPPPHDPRCALGLEHLGFVVGPNLEAFRERHAHVISGQQDQGPYDQPLFISLGAGRLVKFHQRSLRQVAELEGHRFDSIRHA
jgi:predicted metalloenzyme YecM